MNRLTPISVFLSLAACLNAGCTTNGSSPVKNDAKAVRTIAVQAAGDHKPTQYSAIIAPNAQVDLAFRIPGYVVELHQRKGADGRIRPLEPGEGVATGMVLAQLRRADYVAVADKARSARNASDAGVHAAEAQIAQSEAGLVQAELDFGRVSKLWEQESVTKPVYDASKAAFDSARAKVDAAKSALVAAREQAASELAQLKEAEIALADTELRAPFDGILLERHLDLGALVAAGTPAFTVADLGVVKGLFSVPDSALRNFRQGQSLTLTVDAFPGEAFQGRVVSVAAAADPTTRSFQIEVSIPNPRLRLRSGLIASIQFEEARGMRGVQIPVDALVHDPIRNCYLVFGIEQKSGKEYAKEILIRPGPLSGSTVLIPEGLNPGQRIIVSGANLLRSGDVVREIE